MKHHPSRGTGFIGRAYIGTSGWSYRSWEKRFYPSDLPKTRQFEFYATHFPAVEINLTFYRLPTLKSVQAWRDKAPAGFVYAIKGSRYITHMKKLIGVGDALHEFFHRLEPLRKRIGVILWQLPPFLTKDVSRLDRFLHQLPKAYEHAVEFRHSSWLDREVLALLRRNRIAHVSVSSQALPIDTTVTGDVAYIRFHGLAGGAAHDYTHSELEPWVEHVVKQARQGKRVFAFFNNDVNSRAPANARKFMELVAAKTYDESRT